MRNKRSRLTLVGVLALAITVTVGLLSGGVADAAKKKKKGKRSFTVSKTVPTLVPGAPNPGGVALKFPIGTVGKKVAKGKVVSLNGVNVTSLMTGGPGFAGGAIAVLVGPTGRNATLVNPVPNRLELGNNETTSGPLTETPNSAVNLCIPDETPPPPPCTDPDATLGPPYAGTVGNQGLLDLSGSSPRGTWFLKVINFNPEPVTVNSVSVTGGLITKPQ
jgi:hypothetical protein